MAGATITVAADPVDRGDKTRVTCTFTNDAGSATDPTAVTARYLKPTGSKTVLVYLTDAALVKSTTGVYYVDITPDIPGRWTVRFEGTGTVAQTDETSFYVNPDDFYVPA